MFLHHKRKYTASNIKNDIKIDLGVDVTYMLAWRDKGKALIIFEGDAFKILQQTARIFVYAGYYIP